MMVVGVKSHQKTNIKLYHDKIDKLKEQFGVDYQQLDRKLRDATKA
ncbi:MAG: hypothetical protein JXR60_08010 [Bacteroidales bacterium]|nr:hypothetical protein [Bacteroidales bacterium]